MNRTETAMARLAGAIERLESASMRASSGDLLLSGELRDARDEVETLKDTTRIVGQRLDETIVRLKTLLGE